MTDRNDCGDRNGGDRRSRSLRLKNLYVPGVLNHAHHQPTARGATGRRWACRATRLFPTGPSSCDTRSSRRHAAFANSGKGVCAIHCLISRTNSSTSRSRAEALTTQLYLWDQGFTFPHAFFRGPSQRPPACCDELLALLPRVRLQSCAVSE